MSIPNFGVNVPSPGFPVFRDCYVSFQSLIRCTRPPVFFVEISLDRKNMKIRVDRKIFGDLEKKY
jgi:hypothetical protein